jgi:hypothetical protein
MSPRTPRRLGTLLAALIGLLVATLLSGCGAAGRPGSALVVDGHVYTPAEIVEATAQINEGILSGASASSAPAEPASEAQIVNLLMISPFVLAEAKGRGLWGPDNPYNSFMAKIHNPTPATVAAVQANSAYFSLDDDGKAALLEDVKAASIAVDPRYGAVNYTTGFLAMPTPDWIVRTPTATDK